MEHPAPGKNASHHKNKTLSALPLSLTSSEEELESVEMDDNDSIDMDSVQEVEGVFKRNDSVIRGRFYLKCMWANIKS